MPAAETESDEEPAHKQDTGGEGWGSGLGAQQLQGDNPGHLGGAYGVNIEQHQQHQQQDDFEDGVEFAYQEGEEGSDASLDSDDFDPGPAADAAQPIDDDAVVVPAPAPAQFDVIDPLLDAESEDGGLGGSETESSDLEDSSEGEEEPPVHIPVNDTPDGTWDQGFQQEWLLPLYPKCPISVIQAVFFLLSIKHEFTIADVAFDQILWAVWFMLPSGTAFPRSLYLCKVMMGVRPLSDYEWHACSNCDRHVWGPSLPKLASDCCPKCQHPRFKPHAAEKLVPFKVSYLGTSTGVTASTSCCVAKGAGTESRVKFCSYCKVREDHSCIVRPLLLDI